MTIMMIMQHYHHHHHHPHHLACRVCVSHLGVHRPLARLLGRGRVRYEGILVRQQPETGPMERVVRPDRPLNCRQLERPAAGAPDVVRRSADGVLKTRKLNASTRNATNQS